MLQISGVSKCMNNKDLIALAMLFSTAIVLALIITSSIHVSKQDITVSSNYPEYMCNKHSVPNGYDFEVLPNGCVWREIR